MLLTCISQTTNDIDDFCHLIEGICIFKFNVLNYILWKTYFSVLNFPHFSTNQLNFVKVFGTQLNQGIWL